MAKKGVKSGYHTVTVKVANLTSEVANTKDGWNRSDALNTTQAKRVSKIYNDLSTLIASYGKLVQKDAKEFDKLGVKIEEEDRKDANGSK
ncbi:hypothetical protein [Listeria innocua]|uniref:hypothetical protein n=1 Tax=Listeria innocua TaxID=1642 RepID=UPI0016281240|nr:hypothetical protein [Listeria innocua]MBC1925538.1 hypothetical protein [Listeria innocua]